ncbi:thioesterase family protein [uncultured Acetobacteroides sp.]|uniref:thioesterase family protein n=1 Tax=uncultured Acetobacteroides sp. TaxID=1760811 RepID=UPI0029F4B2D4|nr:thioesterase family protein [uncultured Acetobacteroides sp.]
MEFNLPVGLSYTSKKKVTIDDVASRYGSGMIDVFATPALVAIMENAALMAVASYLPEGFNTVGIEISTTHVKATPIGMEVKATARLINVDGKKLTFEIVAEDEEGVIGKGVHSRFIIDTEKFMAKLTKK